MSRILTHVRSRMVAGLLLLLPLLITVWLLRILFGVINDNVTPAVMVVLDSARLAEIYGAPTRIVAPFVGIVLTALVVYLFGVVAGNLVGRRLWEAVEQGILRIPVVKAIYGASRQLLDAIRASSKGGFSRVVLVEYPRPGLWTIGFVTNESGPSVGSAEDRAESIAVFLPTTPNPTSGWLVFAPSQSVVDLEVTVEEGMKLVVSGGIVMPDAFVPRSRG